ncbi:MAG: hypothetical protein ACP5OZ_05080 [Candidatus Woesearchaeota archaeon]
MQIFDSLKELEKTREFKNWRKNNEDCYLVSFFYISDKPDEIQIDYYNKKKNAITSFAYSKNYVFAVKDSDVMAKTQKELKPLVLEGVSELENALKTALEFLKKRHPSYQSNKTIMILQDDNGVVWNIIFITNNFKVVNLKLDAKSLDFISEKEIPIFDFVQR